MASPTSRTLELLRKEGWTAEVVERWNPHSKTRKDLFGGIDVLGMKIEPIRMLNKQYAIGGFLGVQATSATNHSARRAKLLSEKRMAVWVAAGGRLEVWSWSKKGARGKRKLWEVRREAITFNDFIPEAA